MEEEVRQWLIEKFATLTTTFEQILNLPSNFFSEWEEREMKIMQQSIVQFLTAYDLLSMDELTEADKRLLTERIIDDLREYISQLTVRGILKRFGAPTDIRNLVVNKYMIKWWIPTLEDIQALARKYPIEPAAVNLVHQTIEYIGNQFTASEASSPDVKEIIKTKLGQDELFNPALSTINLSGTEGVKAALLTIAESLFEYSVADANMEGDTVSAENVMDVLRELVYP